MTHPADNYRGFSDLAHVQVEGIDYRIEVRPHLDSAVVIIAPHGGDIEPGTSDIARSIAGEDFSLYVFEGIRSSENYGHLHLTSHRFDEPQCLDLVSKSDHVVAVHGCLGEERQVLIGGLDTPLKNRIVEELHALGIDARLEGHDFPAVNAMNICNRGRRGVGAQIEITRALRRHQQCQLVSVAIRTALFDLQRSAPAE